MDPAWDAAIQRAGLLRVQDTHELFRRRNVKPHAPLRGEKLMIVSNGAAPAATALDELWLRNGKLATLGEETLQRLRDALPGSVVPDNPSICAMMPAAIVTLRRSRFCWIAGL